jgi:predicted enzyme related to lactoylglutathione lyase
MSTRLSGIELRVHDVDAAYRFYRELVGLELDVPASDGPADDRHSHAVWGSAEQGTRLLLTIRGAGQEPISRTRVSFVVPDLDGTHARMVRAGIEVRRVPEDLSWGRVSAYSDPDGNIVTLVQSARS